MHDPRIWGPDVKEFKPERFMGEKAKELPDPSSLSFGFGKRCVSRNLMNTYCSALATSVIRAWIHYIILTNRTTGGLYTGYAPGGFWPSAKVVLSLQRHWERMTYCRWTEKRFHTP